MKYRDLRPGDVMHDTLQNFALMVLQVTTIGDSVNVMYVHMFGGMAAFGGIRFIQIQYSLNTDVRSNCSI